jgi:hypothetical protein
MPRLPGGFVLAASRSAVARAAAGSAPGIEATVASIEAFT